MRIGPNMPRDTLDPVNATGELEKMKDGNRMQEKDGHGIIIKYHDHNQHQQSARLTPRQLA